MPTTPHTEKHFTSGDTVRDIVIGMSDGLTVPFALAAGLTGAISQTHLIVTAGFAEIAAGSIAMASADTSRLAAMPSITCTSWLVKNAKSLKCPTRKRRK
jgi:VIT family